MEDINNLKPYLNLRDGEKILFINRYKEDLSLPIEELYKYHESEKFPKNLITKKKKNYVYRPIDIITNLRIIQFGLNFLYVKEDQVTPISEVIHIENLILWINNEDILDFKIDFGAHYFNTIQFKFYYKVGIRSQKNPIYINCFNYKNYLRVKELSIELFKIKKEEIYQEEQEKINEIMFLNKTFFIVGMLGLAILGGILLANVNLDSSLETELVMLNYSSVIIYPLYLAFFLLFNIINLRKLRKIRKTEEFIKLMKKPFAWYDVPMKSFIFFAISGIIVTLELMFSWITENIFLIQLMIAGFFLIMTLFIILVGNIVEKKREKKSLQAVL